MQSCHNNENIDVDNNALFPVLMHFVYEALPVCYIHTQAEARQNIHKKYICQDLNTTPSRHGTRIFLARLRKRLLLVHMANSEGSDKFVPMHKLI